MEKTSFSAADEPTLKAAAIASILERPSLMEWRVKAHPHRTFPIDAGLGSFTAIGICIFLWIQLFMADSAIRDFFKYIIIIVPLQMGFFWWVARKKRFGITHFPAKAVLLNFGKTIFKPQNTSSRAWRYLQ
jgi:hypothetical protein